MFDITLLNKTINIISKRNSGKSVLIKYLVNKEKKLFDRIFIISPSEQINSFYESLTPSKFIFDSFNESWCNNIIKKMTESMLKKENFHILIIFDDCLCDSNIRNSESLRIIFTRGRHINISIITSLQYIHQLLPVCRTNADFVFAGNSTRNSIELLEQDYNTFLKKDTFFNMYKIAIKNYGFFVINNGVVKDTTDVDSIYGRFLANI